MKSLILMSAAVLAVACNAEVKKSSTPVVEGDRIVLVTPPAKEGLTVNEALSLRSSSREYTSEPLTLEELSGVMWAAAGVNRADGKLTAPSALALYPVKVYAFLPGGVYLYDSAAHALVRVVEGDLRALSARQPFAEKAALNIAYIADTEVYAGRDIPAEHVRFLCGQDAAGYAENVNIYAAGHGLKAITRGSAQDAEMLAALGLDPERYVFVLAQTVGK